jgi:integrase
MRIFKRGSTWSYRFDIAKIAGFRQYEQKGGFSTKKEAATEGTKALNNYNNSGTSFKPSEISVADYYDLWMKDYALINCKRTTISGYTKRIKNYIKPAIGKYRLAHLTPHVLQNLINEMFNSGFSRNTIVSIKGLLTGALNYAVHPLKLLAYSPASAIRLPSKRATPKTPTRKKNRIPVTDEQFDVILQRFPEGTSAHLPIQIAARAGLREGEVFAQSWDDIDLNTGKVTVNWQVQMDEDAKLWTLELPKYDSVRSFYIDADLIELLKRTKERQEANRREYAEYYTRLFINEKRQIVKEDTGKEIFLVNVREDGTYIQPRIVAHIGRVVHYELGFSDYDFHSLRHTHSTKLNSSGVSFVDIKERLGHCDIKTSLTYTHADELLKQQTKSVIDNIYAKKPLV